jgi:ribonuclease Z
MDVLLLGTAGYHPSETRQTTCVFLPEAGIVLDAGTGLFRLREHLATRSLDIFLSHAHLDHIVGLTFLLGVLWQKEVERIRLFGDGSKLAAVRQHLFDEALFPVAPSFEAVPIAPGLVLEDGVKVTHFPLAHPIGRWRT